VKKPGFVTEITGLRAIAATVILGAHYSWVSGLSSGLTFFLMISGYVSGAKIKRALADNRKLGLGKDLKNTLWKLMLPMHILLLILTVWIYLDVDVLKKLDWFKSIFAMSLGYGNYYEIQNATDYWVRTTILSPTLHLWAMSMLIQAAIVLTVVRFIVSRVAINLDIKIRKIAIGISLGISAFFCFVDVYSFDGTTAYHFNSLNWAWAFLLGLTLGGMSWRWKATKNNVRIADFIFVAILILGVLPVFGLEPLGNGVRPAMGILAAIVLLAPTNADANFQKFLNARATQFVGGISFGIYLIHWPVLIAFRYYTDPNRNRVATNEPAPIHEYVDHVAWYYLVLLAIFSFLLAWLLQKLVQAIYSKTDGLSETKKIPLQLFALALVPILVFSIQGTNSKPSEDVYKNLVPSLDLVTQDVPKYSQTDCQMGFVRVCSYGNEKSDTSIAIIGTSTAGQWFDSITSIADKNNWHLQILVREGCTHASGRELTFCNQWRDQVVQLVTREKPDLVIMETSHATKDDLHEQVVKSDQILLKPFAQAGISVMGIRTTPRFSFMIPECIAANSEYETLCGIDISSFQLPDSEYQSQVNSSQFVEMVDLTDVICPNGFCSPVDGNIIRYVDDKHLTSTYLKTLSDDLEPYLLRALSQN